MKSVVDSFFAAFSLYSILPMPRTQWTSRSIRFSLCFFPLIGTVIGALNWGWFWLSNFLNLTPTLFAVVATLIPLIITGGIHMDGFIDTCDAVASHAPPEKRLDILKDPHVGAFGVLYCACMLLLQFGLWYQVYATPALLWFPVAGYVLSRACNAFTIAVFTPAKTSGLVHLFNENAARKVAVTTCILFYILVGFVFLYVNPTWGAIALQVTVLYIIWHRHFCLHRFGGNTGDLAGFLLQNLETVFLLLAVLGGVWA